MVALTSSLLRFAARCACLCALLALVPAASAQSSSALDLSDMYANPNEAGWGLHLAQQGDVTFASLFNYDANGKPTDTFATLSSTDGRTWTGDLFRTSGPWFGAAVYDPVLLTIAKVGTLTIVRTAADSLTLQYTIDGVAVTKNVSRVLLRYDNYSGNYVATVYVVTSHCSNAADNGANVGSYAIGIQQSGTTMSITGAFAKRGTSTCRYDGTYSQAGRAGSLGASYTCSDGDAGSMGFFELSKRAGMFSGLLQGHSITDSCDYTGMLTGLVPL